MNTYKNFSNYFVEDRKRYLKEGDRIPNIKDYFLHNEHYFLYHYVKELRKVEWYKNRNKLLYLIHYYFYRKLQFKLRIVIYPGTIGPGLRIYHAGDFIHVGKNVKVGRHCTLLPGVVFGNKGEYDDGSSVIVGDNCYFGLGAKIFGSLIIGDNAVIGANSVVTHDVPKNAVVGGVPAQIIKFKEVEP